MIEVKSYVFWEFCRDLLEYGKQGYTLETSNKYFPQQFGGYLEVHLNEPIVCGSAPPVDETYVGNEMPALNDTTSNQESGVVDTELSSSEIGCVVVESTPSIVTVDNNDVPVHDAAMVESAPNAEPPQQARRGRPPKK